MEEKNNNPEQKILIFALSSAVLLIGYYIFRLLVLQGRIALPEVTGLSQTNLIAIFLTGLFTGGLSCLAVQGGLLAATIAQREEEKLKEGMVQEGSTAAAFPIIAFLIAKLAAYTVLGFFLGWLGSILQLSLTVKVIMQIIVAIFMIGTAMNILNVHPVFRYFIIQPPKFLTRKIRNQSKSKAVFAPAILGAFTIFIPCGTTQAIMALSIASGSPVLGATILFAFILGTSPVFFTLGYFAAKLGDAFQAKFMKIAALAIILLAIFNLNNAVALTGSRFTLENGFSSISKALAINNTGTQETGNAVNEATIEFERNYYAPNNITVKGGSNVTLNLVNKAGAGCIQAFTIPVLGLQKIVPVGSSDTISFTAPQGPTQIAFMCAMGMFRGIINVI